MTKHSPGPWKWSYAEDDGDEFGTDSLYDANRQALGFYNEGRDNKPTIPDAILIASAPDMLALLRELDEKADECPICWGTGVNTRIAHLNRFELGRDTGELCPFGTLLDKLGRE